MICLSSAGSLTSSQIELLNGTDTTLRLACAFPGRSCLCNLTTIPFIFLSRQANVDVSPPLRVTNLIYVTGSKSRFRAPKSPGVRGKNSLLFKPRSFRCEAHSPAAHTRMYVAELGRDDTERGVPLVNPVAQLAFKDLMIH
jgi:hypothetical protein